MWPFRYEAVLRWRSPQGKFSELKLLRSWVSGIGVLLLMGVASAHAALGSVTPEDRRDYEAVASTRSWSVAPSGSYRIFLDIYNNADYYDSEPGGKTSLFADRTVLTDTIRPVMTVLWDQ